MMEEKSSVSRVQKSTGTYRFRIEGFSGLSTRVGDSVESPEFSLCGLTWQLRIFPGGSLEAHKGYISYYLASKSNRIARASYKLSIVNQIIGGEDESFASSGIRIFEAKGIQVDGWGRDKFMLSTMLRDSEFGFLIDDAIIFKVEITAYGDLEEATSNYHKSSTELLLSGMSQQFSNLQASIKALYNDETTSDLTMYLGVKREIFHGHRCILSARSEVFQIMFSSPMKECCKGEIDIPEYEANVIKVLLTYIYTDELPEKVFMNEFASALMSIAVKYQVLGMIHYCEDHFYNYLQVENAISVLKFADSVGAMGLKIKSMHFIAQHANRIMQGKEFQDLDEDLQKEMNLIIDVVNKRRGCRGMIEKDRKTQMSCAIM